MSVLGFFLGLHGCCAALLWHISLLTCQAKKQACHSSRPSGSQADSLTMLRQEDQKVEQIEWKKKLQGARHLLLRHVWGCRPGIVKQLHGSYMSFTRKEQTQSASVQSKSEGMSTVAILSCQTFVPLPEHSIVEMNWMIFIGKLMDFRWH